MSQDRHDAGRRLAAKLQRYVGRPGLLVLALPRGGVPVAYEVAMALDAPLDVFVVRKLGVPGQEELAMGAIASGGMRVLNEDVITQMRIPAWEIERAAMHELRELERREAEYRGELPPPQVRGKTVILVDDGFATGATMRAAVFALRRLGPARLVVAVPVGAAETCHDFCEIADDVVCATEPAPFRSVGNWYQNFDQTTDEEVRELLAAASRETATT